MARRDDAEEEPRTRGRQVEGDALPRIAPDCVRDVRRVAEHVVRAGRGAYDYIDSGCGRAAHEQCLSGRLDAQRTQRFRHRRLVVDRRRRRRCYFGTVDGRPRRGPRAPVDQHPAFADPRPRPDPLVARIVHALEVDVGYARVGAGRADPDRPYAHPPPRGGQRRRRRYSANDPSTMRRGEGVGGDVVAGGDEDGERGQEELH